MSSNIGPFFLSLFQCFGAKEPAFTMEIDTNRRRVINTDVMYTDVMYLILM